MCRCVARWICITSRCFILRCDSYIAIYCTVHVRMWMYELLYTAIHSLITLISFCLSNTHKHPHRYSTTALLFHQSHVQILWGQHLAMCWLQCVCSNTSFKLTDKICCFSLLYKIWVMSDLVQDKVIYNAFQITNVQCKINADHSLIWHCYG